jgi:hypothetical protein
MTKATTLDLVYLAREVGGSIGIVNELEAKAVGIKELANQGIAALHNAKAKIGTYKKDGTGCALATAFMDGCVKGGVSQSTAQKTYLPTFKAHVASGKPVTQWNLQRAKAKAAKGEAKGTGKTLAQKLATCFRDEGFEDFLQELTASFENAEIDSLREGIESYLIMQGALKEGESE